MIRAYYHPPANVRLPDWAGNLNNYYWMIRVEGRNKAKRLKYYRLAEKEKLRLAEKRIDQDLIKSVCRFLAGFNPSRGMRMNQIMYKQPEKLKLEFTYQYER